MKTEKVLRKYVKGEALKVTEGLYQGFTGTCTKIQNDYAVILLSLLSGKFEIKLPLRSVQPV